MNLPDARLASDSTAANISGDTSVAFQKVTLDAISTSIGNKTNSATISCSGKAGADVMATLQELMRKGYKVTRSGTYLTISW